MSYVLVPSIFYRIPLLLFSLLVLSACETELPSDNLRIVSRPPSFFDYYAQIDEAIEIAGGTGTYNVRYVQNVEPGIPKELTENILEPNPIKLVVTKEVSAKNTFRLTGLATPEDDGDPSSDNDSTTKKYTYWLEYRDAETVKWERVDFSIRYISFNLDLFSATVVEGVVKEDNISQAISRNIPLCEGGKDYTSVAYDSPYGRVYPLALLLGLDRLIATRVTFEYEVTSDYDVSLPNTSSKNISHAQPWVDFIPVEKASFTLEPGQLGCPIWVELLDDNLIEKRESVLVNVLSISGVSGDYGSMSGSVSLIDNEPALSQFSGDFVLNPGESADIELSISANATKDAYVNIVVNDALTTASTSEYSIFPATRVVRFPAGQRYATFSVRAEALNSVTGQDKNVVLKDALSAQTEEEAVTISINQWVSDTVLSNSSSFDAIDMVVSEDSRVFTVSTIKSSSSNKVGLQAYDAQGSLLKLNNLDMFEIAKTGVELEAKGLLARENGSGSELIVVLETTSNYGGVAWGGRDFVILNLLVSSSGVVTELSRSQHGSELDDVITDFYIGDDSSVFISGTTQGTTLDGGAPFAANSGNDGFIYAFSQDLASINWSRFVGDVNSNEVVGVDANTSRTTTLITSGDEQAFVRTLDNSPNAIGADDLDFEDFELIYPAPVDWVFWSTNNRGGFLALGDSLGDLKTNSSTTDSLSRDVYLASLSTNSLDRVPVSNSIATSSKDVAVSVAMNMDESTAAVVGSTQGQFPDAKKQEGAGTWDAFFTPFDFTSSIELGETTQFGTPGNDHVIDVEPSGDNKFIVLWKEDHTSGDGTFRYRLTPFSKDGRKLTPDI